LIALAVLAVLIGGAWYLTHRPPAASPPGGPEGFGMGRRPGPSNGPGAGPPVTVGEVTVQRADVPVTLGALGTVTPRATVTVTPQVAGVLTGVLFTEGQRVRKGQLLARIDARPYQQALAQARGARMRDEAQLAAARVTLGRYQTLLKQDSIAVQDVDTQTALVKQLEGTVLADRGAEASARLNVEYASITSPVTGRVGLRLVDPGNYVGAGGGAGSSGSNGIVIITQVDPIDVEFTVPQDRVPDIEQRTAEGAKLAVTAYDRTRTRKLAQGDFLTLDNVVDTSTGTVKAKARFDNPGGILFPSQFVNVELVLHTIANALVIPVTALRTSGEGDYVYVINANRTVSMRKVKRGEASMDSVLISEGLREGERVVTEGGDRLKDGSRVQLAGDPPRAGAHAPGAPGPQGPSQGAQGGPRGAGHHHQSTGQAADDGGKPPGAQKAAGAPPAAAPASSTGMGTPDSAHVTAPAPAARPGP
jgi:multidrug efflux system membrane fusion protein